MKIIGIVIEANPFHNGHKYFIDTIKNKYNPDLIIAVTSTSFSMRGEISLIDKFDKTKILLDNNVDIVMELPVINTLQSADYFASASIKILNNLGVTDLVFGSETEDLSLYEKVYDSLIFKEQSSSKNLSKKDNFNKLLTDLKFSKEEILLIESPNFTLGLQYIRYIKNNNLKINYHLLKRINNNYHDKIITSNIASATSIRYNYKKNHEINNLIPYNKDIFINIHKSEENLLNVIKYVYKVNNNYIKTDFLFNEGIQNYIHNNGNFELNYEDFISNLKNKKYTLSTISRSILHNLIETKNLINTELNYTRILGVNNIGLNYIKSLSKEKKNHLFSNPKEIKSNNNLINELLNYELKATSLYEVITNKKILINEYKLPIRKDI